MQMTVCKTSDVMQFSFVQTASAEAWEIKPGIMYEHFSLECANIVNKASGRDMHSDITAFR